MKRLAEWMGIETELLTVEQFKAEFDMTWPLMLGAFVFLLGMLK